MASGDLYQIKVFGNCRNQALLNIYHYYQTAGSGGANQLGPTFENQVLIAGVEYMLHQSYQRTSYEVRDKADPTDFYVDGSYRYGQFAASGDSMPTQDALSFQYLCTRLDARTGGKRFGTYGEFCQAAGAPTGGFVSRYPVAEAILEASIDDTSGNSWRPVVYGKRTGSSSYFSNYIASVRFFGFTTQNNRKFYTSPGV